MQNLRLVKKIMKGTDWWLDCGTLLFLVREGRPDPVDDDISIDSSNLGDVINKLPEFLKNGFKLHKIYTHPELGITEISFRRNDRPLDIFVKYQIRGKHLGVSWYGDYQYWELPITEETICFPYGSLHYPIPVNPGNYLEKYYGEWKIPNPEWKHTDPPCIVRNYEF
jgi:hypothetical protein